MLEHMLLPLMPNARELLERVQPWLFDDDSATDLALLHAIGVLGSMREAELALFYRGHLEPVAGMQGYADEYAVVYPACNGHGSVTSASAVHATRRRLHKLVEEKLLNVAIVERTTSDHLAGRYYWLTRRGAQRVLDAGYRVRGRQNIHNMTHVGSVQDQHRLLEQQYIVARRLIRPSLRVWGEYAIRSGLARQPTPADAGTRVATIREQLVAMSGALYLTPAELGLTGVANTEANRRYFTRRPDVLLLDEQPERERYLDATGHNPHSTPPHVFGDIDWTEVEASKKDAVTQGRSFNGIFYLGRMLDASLERGLVTKFTLVTRNHPHANLRAKLLDAYERWLSRADVQVMLQKNARLTAGFDPERLGEQVWLTELTQDSEHRLTGIRMESVASIALRERRGGF
ncbi:hypothetical protein [Rhizobacter sp. SG703]|uniref:hypothetical protein n=1 Tax=Rhizobacter sp. SG703 TaxID=2587140 RepID=UPI0014460385|nr:hypothetical protein [Rhizobacter sp. SG703]NKI93891.1 hypothetical protein [Rhizobacter sp. SG703]